MTHKLFEDLGFSPQKAAVLKLKADLHTKIVKAASRYSQSELEKILQTSQPRISDLLRGKMSKFSLDMLVVYAEQLGAPRVRTVKTKQAKETSRLEAVKKSVCRLCNAIAESEKVGRLQG